MTLGKKPRRYQLRTGDRFAVTPKSGRGRFSIWPALLFILVACIYYLNTEGPGSDRTLIADKPEQNQASDRIITGTVPVKQ